MLPIHRLEVHRIRGPDLNLPRRIPGCERSFDPITEFLLRHLPIDFTDAASPNFGACYLEGLLVPEGGLDCIFIESEILPEQMHCLQLLKAGHCLKIERGHKRGVTCLEPAGKEGRDQSFFGSLKGEKRRGVNRACIES